MKEEISILIEDNNRLYLKGMEKSVKLNFPKAFVKKSSYSELSQLILERWYDIYVLDFEEQNILKLVREIMDRNPSAKIIMNTIHENIWIVQQILEYKVSAVLVKQNNFNILIDCIKSMQISMGTYFCRRFDYMNVKKETLHKNDQLSSREMQVLRYVSQGKTTEEAARLMDISPHTVETHRRSIREKLNAETPSHVISLALAHGLLKINELTTN